MFFITSFFSISPLHVRWLLPYIIKNNSSERLSSSTSNRSPCLDQCNGKFKLITHLCCPFRTNYRSSHQRCSIKKGVLRNFARFTGEHRPEACNFIQKETLAQVFSCEFSEISKNIFFTEHLWTTAAIITWIFTDICIVIVSTKFVAQRRQSIQKHRIIWHLETCQICKTKLFVKIFKGQKLLTVFAKKLQALRHATLLKRDFNIVSFK